MDEENPREPEEVEKGAYLRSEEVEGVVQCNTCDYWNIMVGYIEPDNRKIIQFVCPKCNSIELVNNFFSQ